MIDWKKSCVVTRECGGLTHEVVYYGLTAEEVGSGARALPAGRNYGGGGRRRAHDDRPTRFFFTQRLGIADEKLHRPREKQTINKVESTDDHT